MRTKTLIGMVVMLLALAGTTAYCHDSNSMGISDVNVVHNFSKAIGITWKLYGFGAVGEDEVQKTKPEKDAECWNDELYTILFKEDGTLEGHTFSNAFWGEYGIDGNNLVIKDLWATEIGEEYDGAKYYEALYSSLTHVFEIRNDQLLLYYDEGKNYLLFDNVTSRAQEYFPEGTKWTEIRLDTLKYDNWYSKVGDEWVPNFETIEYYVKGKFYDGYGGIYNCVFTNGPEWTDSLMLLIPCEGDFLEPNSVMVSVLSYESEGVYAFWPAEVYQFDWSVGKGIYFRDITMSNTTYALRYHQYYGIIHEIKEGYFGGVRPLKYVDLDGKAPEDDPNSNIKNGNTKGGRIIQGIGITEWNDGECLFGPPDPYDALDGEYHGRHYRSMLVHFEQNGEVLYDVWPEKEATNGIKPVTKVNTPTANTIYDLSGRKIQGASQKGVYIQGGKKHVVR